MWLSHLPAPMSREAHFKRVDGFYSFYSLVLRFVKCVPGSSFDRSRKYWVDMSLSFRFRFCFCRAGLHCHFVRSARRQTTDDGYFFLLLTFGFSGIKFISLWGSAESQSTNHVWNIIFKCNLLDRGSPFNTNTEHKRPNDEQFPENSIFEW